MKKVLVLGGTGATGRLVINELLKRGEQVVAINRRPSEFISHSVNREQYSEVIESISEMTEKDLASFVKGCDAIVSCLGHNLTFKGMYGEPKKLVSGSIEKCREAIELLPTRNKIKLILMNTSGNANPDIAETPPLSQRIAVKLIRKLIPPHVDNELASAYLRDKVGSEHEIIEWACVRPDALTNDVESDEYDLHESPVSNVIFNSGNTSRLNVARFMADLIEDDILWQKWKFKMPVIYDKVLTNKQEAS